MKIMNDGDNLTKIPRCPHCAGLTKRMTVRKNPGRRYVNTKYYYCEGCDNAFIPNVGY